jgi:hypothetical protein
MLARSKTRCIWPIVLGCLEKSLKGSQGQLDIPAGFAPTRNSYEYLELLLDYSDTLSETRELDQALAEIGEVDAGTIV